jgi:capsular exopolysaccharide synthesis family protein
MVAEAFRTIRTSLLLASADSPPRTVLVTSPQKGEGKTTIASNLAIVLAQAGQRTVLIDTDIRSPSIDRRFLSHQRNRGLVEYLTGHLALEEVIQETVVPRLWIIPAGTAAPNPAELVGSRKMGELLSLLSRRYDQVILDSPPLLPFSDSLMMSHIVDGVLLVARSEVSEKRAVGEAIERLRSIRAPLLGVVMNGVPTERAKWSEYSSYYGDSSIIGNAMPM